MRSDKWIYEQSPTFTNNIETRLSWGMIDLYLSVENNLIVQGKAYSDCLFPDFIEAINELINSKKINYDRRGVKTLENLLVEKFKNKPEFTKFSQELGLWMEGAL